MVITDSRKPKWFFYPAWVALSSISIPIPNPIFLAVEHIINMDMRRAFEREEVDTEKLRRLILEANRWGIHLDKAAIEYDVSSWVTSLMEKVQKDLTDPSLFVRITQVLDMLKPLSLKLNLWKAQNMFFSLKGQWRAEIDEKGTPDDESKKEWSDAFNDLGEKLHIKVS